MQRIKTSENNKAVVSNLTKSKFNFRDDRTIAQIAFAYSIQQNKSFEINDFEKVDNKGKEYPESIFGEINQQSNDAVYRAILNQHYNRSLTDDEFYKFSKLHIDHGLDVLNRDILQNRQGRNSHIDYLLNIVNRGINKISSSTSLNSTKTGSKNIKAYSKLIEIELGKDTKTNKSLKIRINDENDFNSQHFAVAGMNGSGKTELVKDILYQISTITKQELKFIFFDYKGEGKSGKLKPFLKQTNCKFIDIQKKPFKFNPLTYVDLTNERNRDFNIKTFRDNIASIDRRIGVKQKSSLQEALNRCFENTIKTGKHPTIQEVYVELLNYYEESKMKEDSLTAILKELSEGIFDENYDAKLKLYDRNMYINLPPTLPEYARQASVFLTLNYLLSEFISCNDVKANKDRIKPIRYVIVIDEAHAYLKQKAMSAVLENLLRMIRSKGVIVMLLSQGVEEYKQKEFDFASQIKIPILLNVQNKDLKVAKSFLGTPKSDVPMQNALKHLEGGKGIINFKTPKLIDINMFWKREE